MSANGPVLAVGGTGILGGRWFASCSRGKRVRPLVRPAPRRETPGKSRRRDRSRGHDGPCIAAAGDGWRGRGGQRGWLYAARNGDNDNIDMIGNRNLAEAASRAGLRRFVSDLFNVPPHPISESDVRHTWCTAGMYPPGGDH
jgi:hypothetical protein